MSENTGVRERLAQAEDCMAVLGNALVYLEMVEHRVQLAAVTGRQGGLLGPAMDDLGQAQGLIRRAQARLGGSKGSSEKVSKFTRHPSVGGAGGDAG